MLRIAILWTRVSRLDMSNIAVSCWWSIAKVFVRSQNNVASGESFVHKSCFYCTCFCTSFQWSPILREHLRSLQTNASPWHGDPCTGSCGLSIGAWVSCMLYITRDDPFTFHGCLGLPAMSAFFNMSNSSFTWHWFCCDIARRPMRSGVVSLEMTLVLRSDVHLTSQSLVGHEDLGELLPAGNHG